jgi:hypothetical protein
LEWYEKINEIGFLTNFVTMGYYPSLRYIALSGL